MTEVTTEDQPRLHQLLVHIAGWASAHGRDKEKFRNSAHLWPASTDPLARLDWEGRRQHFARERARRKRARDTAQHRANLAAEEARRNRPIHRDVILSDAAALTAWLRTEGPRQRQLLPLAREIMRERVALLQARVALDRNPKPREFARFLASSAFEPATLTQDEREKHLKRLFSLEGEGLPWPQPPQPEPLSEADLADIIDIAGTPHPDRKRKPQPERVAENTVTLHTVRTYLKEGYI